jgi:hypothetical protein
MRELRPFHHYSSVRSGGRTPVELLEEQVVAMLLESPVEDESRDSSICFELKHSAAVTQFGRLLARRRGLPPELCAAGGLLHDIYVIVEGGYSDHAHRGAPIAREMVEAVGGFEESQILDLESIVYNHSDKHLNSDDPFAEFGKDIDVLDAFLYPGAFEWYLANKPLPVFRHYLTRARRVWAELEVPADSGFAVLDDYQPGWLDRSLPLASDLRPGAVGASTPPFLLLHEQGGWTAHFRRSAWRAADGLKTDQVEPRVARAASSVLPQVQSMPAPCAAMIWPAIGAVERIEAPALAARLEELIGGRTPEIDLPQDG